MTVITERAYVDMSMAPDPSLDRVGTVVLAPDDFEPDPAWQVLCAAPTHQHHVVLLQRVTFTRDKGRHHSAIAKLDTAAFTASRVRFPRCTNKCLENNALQLWSASKQAGWAGLLLDWAMAYDLVDGA